ncbi:MAG TPA: zf-HC2 domain-containing protein [Bryobacteraceae bacterium]|jgi:hypothetical protein|nr:zf-HC2 domain-containing protein [Bryobacteraceae bacterium]
MCKFSSKLVARLDSELPAAEAAAMDLHVAACRECREQAEAFRGVSHAFAVYARAVPPRAARSPRRWLWVPAAIAAAVLTVFLIWPRWLPSTQPNLQRRAEAIPAMTAAVPLKAAVAVASVRHARAPKRVQKQVSAWMPAEPTIQIIIPADALFPPGALPEGVGFVADLRLASNGAAGGLALRP